MVVVEDRLRSTCATIGIAEHLLEDGLALPGQGPYLLPRGLHQGHDRTENDSRLVVVSTLCDQMVDILSAKQEDVGILAFRI